MITCNRREKAAKFLVQMGIVVLLHLCKIDGIGIRVQLLLSSNQESFDYKYHYLVLTLFARFHLVLNIIVS